MKTSNQIINHSAESNVRKSSTDPLLKNIIKNSGINTFGTVFNKLSRYFSVLIVIKILGVTGYGYYTIGLTVIGIGIIMANAGLNYGVYRFVPIFIGQDNIAKVKGVIIFCVKFVTISGMIIALGLFLFSEFISVSLYNKPDLVKYIKLFSLTLPFIVLSAIIINIFKGFNVIKYKVLIDDFIVTVSKILLFLCCLVFGLGATGVIMSYLASRILGLIIGFILLLKIFPNVRDSNIKPDVNHREIISYSTPLFLSSFFTIFLNQTDILMLSYYQSPDQIGIYSIANRLSVLVFFIASSTFAIFSPAIAKLLGKGQYEDMEIFLNKISRLVLITTMPIFLIITIFSKEALTIFGKEFTAGNTALLILASSFLFNSLIGFAGQILGVMGRSKLMLINSLGASILNIVLNYVLIPRYGIIGAAMATGFSIFAINLARTIEIYILEDFSILKSSLIKPFLVGAATGGVVLCLKQLLNYQVNLQYFIMFATICLVLYCLLTWVLVLNNEDKHLVYDFMIKSKKFLFNHI